MTHFAQGTRQARLERETDRLLARIGPANRAFVEKSVQYRRNKGLKAGSVRAYVNALHKADAILGGRAFASVSPDELAGLIGALRARCSERYVATLAIHLRTCWAELHKVRKPLDLPGEVYRALEVREPRAVLVGYVIPDEDFEAMLRLAADYDGETSVLHRGFMLVALLWLLRDSGFRISEALSLNIGDVQLDEAGARLALRPDAPDLKTGPRTIYVARCIPAVKAWMAMHPQAGNAKAPLFCGLRDHTGLKRLGYLVSGRVVKDLAERSGASAKISTGQPITPHDFRHTRATEVARNREMSEEEMRRYFGWSAGSKMPSTYIHLTLGDMKESVLRAAGLSPLGTKLPTLEVGASAEDFALLKKLRSLLA